ncbi:MAG: chemotaxis protein [Firmicutes bacterium HGW-Firmicutes-15]|nr:MAG: chemotaxis protein [Firmicutes bacterium HGW-Firmicutes-15]
MDIAIIGGGKGGATILNAFREIEQFNIIGICDINENAPGVQMARKLKVRVYDNLEVLLKEPGLDMVIEATGNANVQNTIYAKKQERTVVVGSEAASAMMIMTEAHDAIQKRLTNMNKMVSFRNTMTFLSRTYTDGVVFFTTNLNAYDFVCNKDIEIKGVRVGEKIVAGGYVQRCIDTCQEVIGIVSEDVYGIRSKIWVLPVLSDDGELLGTCGLFIPKVHPVFSAFDMVAPLVVESHPEGAWVGLTDTKNLINRLASDKFDIKEMQIGYKLREGDAGSRVLKAKSKVEYEQHTKKYGNFRIIGIPLVDNETGEIIGSFGIGTPRNSAHQLNQMATELSSHIQEIASISEEVAASADEISTNELSLAQSIQGIKKISGQINETLDFTKNVASQTKMLGLNAAIEAARVGEHGRGFGVVADEIRKLSEQSRDTANQIGRLTVEIEEEIVSIVSASDNSVKQSQEQAAATTQVTTSIMEMANLAEKLAEIAKSI